METTVKELPDSRVRVDVDVDPQDVEGSISRTAQQLGQDMKLPGFRKGKVPPEMVVQRLGRQTVLTQALESSLGDWYERAMLDSGVNPVGDPKLDLSDLPEEGKPLRFSIEVAVRPGAELGEYRGLEVGRAEPEVPEEAVETEINRLREGFARLNPVERAAKQDDVVLIDYEGKIDGEPFEGGTRPRLPAGAGGGPCPARARAGPRGGGARRRAPGDRAVPRRLSRRGGRRQDRRVRRQGQGGPREGAAGAQRRLRLRGFGVRHPRRAARGHLREDQADPRRPDRRALPRGRPRRRRRQGEGRAPRARSSRRRAEEMWRRVERSAAASRGWTRRTTSRSRARRARR